jgi:hypothetical protein
MRERISGITNLAYATEKRPAGVSAVSEIRYATEKKNLGFSQNRVPMVSPPTQYLVGATLPTGDFVSSMTIIDIVKLTQAEYDALVLPVPTTLYVIVG